MELWNTTVDPPVSIARQPETEPMSSVRASSKVTDSKVRCNLQPLCSASLHSSKVEDVVMVDEVGMAKNIGLPVIWL